MHHNSSKYKGRAMVKDYQQWKCTQWYLWRYNSTVRTEKYRSAVQCTIVCWDFRITYWMSAWIYKLCAQLQAQAKNRRPQGLQVSNTMGLIKRKPYISLQEIHLLAKVILGRERISVPYPLSLHKGCLFHLQTLWQKNYGSVQQAGTWEICTDSGEIWRAAGLCPVIQRNDPGQLLWYYPCNS